MTSFVFVFMYLCVCVFVYLYLRFTNLTTVTKPPSGKVCWQLISGGRNTNVFLFSLNGMENPYQCRAAYTYIQSDFLTTVQETIFSSEPMKELNPWFWKIEAKRVGQCLQRSCQFLINDSALRSIGGWTAPFRRYQIYWCTSLAASLLGFWFIFLCLSVFSCVQF